MDNINYDKFPEIFQNKLKNGDLEFSIYTKFKYKPIKAFRGVVRGKNDCSEVNNNDFLSYADLGVTRRSVNKNDISYYGVSLFDEKVKVENALKFPRDDRKIAEGYVYQEGGPCEFNEMSGHINWWLYKDIYIQNFRII